MGHKSQHATPVNRQGVWYLVRRVPKEFSTFDPRGMVTISTGVRVRHDPRGILAKQRVAELDAQLQTFWRQCRDGLNPRAAAVALKATQRGQDVDLPVLSLPKVTELGVAAVIERLLKATAARPIEDLIASSKDQALSAPSLAFGIPTSAAPTTTSGLRVSQMLEEFERINATTLARKSPRQRHKWKVHRQTALDVFLETIGEDCAVTHLSTAHTHRFRAHWQERAIKGQVQINSANRRMRAVAGLYKAIHSFHQLDQKNPFTAIRIPGGRDGKRVPYPPSFVQNHFLAQDMFADLNHEARRIIYLIVETGLRPSEACALTRDTIHLNCPVPFIEVSNEHRETKTAGSVRVIPLVGVALLAMQQHPDGFPRYYDKPDALTALLNKALTARNLRPAGPKQSIYSLRHTLVDRLKAVEAPKDIQEDIQGHVHTYGEGTTLAHRHAWLQKIAFTPPASI
ncbi:hypothetical protein [Hyphomicrobium sp. DY-1]|uniref:hypothetical protein n=1 Tax=Hyphomicrobium sp. DY-1 TaxID=3075650 RepID=UPI0039C0668A